MTIHQHTALIIRSALWHADDGTRGAIAELAHQLAEMFKTYDAGFCADWFFAAAGVDR